MSITSQRPVQAAIAERRSIRQFHDSPVDRAVIQRMLNAAVQAPNHRRSTPWRFFVVDDSSSGRERLADMAVEAALARAQNPADAGAQARAAAKASEIRETPVLVLVFAVPGRNEFETRENYGATCCAVQNMLLAGVEEGVASGWSTGGVCQHPGLADYLGADSSWQLVGLIFVGRPAPQTAELHARAGWEPFTTWVR